jgi:hypothetical protein
MRPQRYGVSLLIIRNSRDKAAVSCFYQLSKSIQISFHSISALMSVMDALLPGTGTRMLEWVASIISMGKACFV